MRNSESMDIFYGFQTSGEKTLEHTRVLQRTPTVSGIEGQQTPPSRLMYNVSQLPVVYCLYSWLLSWITFHNLSNGWKSFIFSWNAHFIKNLIFTIFESFYKFTLVAHMWSCSINANTSWKVHNRVPYLATNLTFL